MIRRDLADVALGSVEHNAFAKPLVPPTTLANGPLPKDPTKTPTVALSRHLTGVAG